MRNKAVSLTIFSLALLGGTASLVFAAPQTIDGMPKKDVEAVLTPNQFTKDAAESPAPLGNPATGAALFEQCAPCHGLDAKGLAGKSEAQLMAAMQNYQTGTFTKEKVLKMQGILRGLSQEQLADLARYINKI